MSRQTCDRDNCHEPAVTFLDSLFGDGEFVCMGHAPEGAEVTY